MSTMKPEGSDGEGAKISGILKVDTREQLNFAFDPGDERLHNDGININPSSSSLGCSKSISFSNGATPTSTEKLETRHSTTIFNGTMAPSSETLVDGRNGTMTPPYRHSEGKHDFTYPNGAMTPSQSPGSIGSRNGISYFDGIDSIPIILQKAPRSKSGRQGFKAGGLLYGEDGYFQHPYGNSENFLTEILSKNTVRDEKADIENRGSSGKLLVWVAFCLFTLGIAGAIIFGAETSTRKVIQHLGTPPITTNLSQTTANISLLGSQ